MKLTAEQSEITSSQNVTVAYNAAGTLLDTLNTGKTLPFDIEEPLRVN